MANAWIKFLQEWRKKNPKVSMKIAMKKAAVIYRASKGKAAAKPAKKSRKAKKKKSK